MIIFHLIQIWDTHKQKIEQINKNFSIKLFFLLIFTKTRNLRLSAIKELLHILHVEDKYKNKSK